MAYRARNILIAVALAAVAALLTSIFVTSYKRHVQRGEDHVTVLVAKRDIPQGTSGADASSMLSPVEVPRRSVVPGAITSADEISSLVASQQTFQGEQVTTRRFSPVAQVGPRADLKGTLRAFQVAGDANQLLAGTLRDGDHVDLVAALKNGNNGEFSRVVLRNLKVLHAPGAPAAGSKITGVNQNFSAMIEMTDSQAQKFQLVLSNREGSDSAGWHLALRPVVHGADSPDSVSTVLTVLRDGLSPAALRKFVGSVAALAQGGQ
jgi:Flp pilus assembly protein CpaB